MVDNAQRKQGIEVGGGSSSGGRLVLPFIGRLRIHWPQEVHVEYADSSYALFQDMDVQALNTPQFRIHFIMAPTPPYPFM